MIFGAWTRPSIRKRRSKSSNKRNVMKKMLNVKLNIKLKKIIKKDLLEKSMYFLLREDMERNIRKDEKKIGL